MCRCRCTKFGEAMKIYFKPASRNRIRGKAPQAGNFRKIKFHGPHSPRSSPTCREHGSSAEAASVHAPAAPSFARCGLAFVAGLLLWAARGAACFGLRASQPLRRPQAALPRLFWMLFRGCPPCLRLAGPPRARRAALFASLLLFFFRLFLGLVLDSRQAGAELWRGLRAVRALAAQLHVEKLLDNLVELRARAARPAHRVRSSADAMRIGRHFCK